MYFYLTLKNSHVILVDSSDQVIGSMEKLEAHQKGLLHRAFSIFIFNDNNQLLIHQRAMGKYHSEGLWTNTCCSHPMPNETIIEAAHRRLKEEMGFDCEMENLFSFVYKVQLENELIEHELDHVVVGKYNGDFDFNKDEVMDFQWVNLNDVIIDLNKNSEKYTYWFKLILTEYKSKFKF